jgi:hypothetical protein
LVGSLFGVSIAVASLTKETSIQDGTMYSKDGSAVVATDSRADRYEVDTFDFGDCLSVAYVEAIRSHVEEGRNIIVSRHHVEGASHQLEILSPSGATFNDETGVACYPLPEKRGKVYCLFPESKVCSDPENRRRLKRNECKSASSNSPSCQAAASCVCDLVPVCLGPNDEGSECLQDGCMLEPCTFTCPALGNEVGDFCSCDSETTLVCHYVQMEDCSNCRV